MPVPYPQIHDLELYLFLLEVLCPYLSYPAIFTAWSREPTIKEFVWYLVPTMVYYIIFFYNHTDWVIPDLRFIIFKAREQILDLAELIESWPRVPRPITL